MSNMFNKGMAHSRSSHRLAKASILSELKQFQHVKESWNLVNRHVWYTVCTPRQEQSEWHVRSSTLKTVIAYEKHIY